MLCESKQSPVLVSSKIKKKKREAVIVGSWHFGRGRNRLWEKETQCGKKTSRKPLLVVHQLQHLPLSSPGEGSTAVGANGKAFLVQWLRPEFARGYLWPINIKAQLVASEPPMGVHKPLDRWGKSGAFLPVLQADIESNLELRRFWDTSPTTNWPLSFREFYVGEDQDISVVQQTSTKALNAHLCEKIFSTIFLSRFY